VVVAKGLVREPENRTKDSGSFSRVHRRRLWHPQGMPTTDPGTPDAVKVTTWHLELTDLADLSGGRTPDVEAIFVETERPTAAFSKWLYHYIGEPWQWTDKHRWPDERWQARVTDPDYAAATCVIGGTPAGYVELFNRAGDVEIENFGLAPDVHGLGLGGWFLTRSVEFGFGLEGARRVWLHTCSLDGPHALANYEARGFRLFDTEVEWKVVDPPIQPGATPPR